MKYTLAALLVMATRAKKHIYMSTGAELTNQAQIAVSNFVLKEYIAAD